MRKNWPVYVVLILLGASILFFGFARLYPLGYESLKIYVFTDEVFCLAEGKSMLPTFHDQPRWYGSPCDDTLCRKSIRRGEIIVLNSSFSRFSQNLEFGKHLINGCIRHSLGNGANQFADDAIRKNDFLHEGNLAAR